MAHRDTELTMTSSNTPGLQTITHGDANPPDNDLYRVVACEGGCNDWAVYMESLYSRKLGNSIEDIQNHGNKISQSDAERLFPNWVERLTWRP